MVRIETKLEDCFVLETAFFDDMFAISDKLDVSRSIMCGRAVVGLKCGMDVELWQADLMGYCAGVGQECASFVCCSILLVIVGSLDGWSVRGIG